MTDRLPVYVSLTSINQNTDILIKTLESIVRQTILPTKIYLYLSETPYLLDTGFKEQKLDITLSLFIKHNPLISVCWTSNIGPYRKLVPLIAEKWDEECLIVTMDDDTVYTPNLLKELLLCWESNRCVISSRVIPLTGNNGLSGLLYSKRLPAIPNRSLYNFHTGKGGVVYHPRYFNAVSREFFCDPSAFNTCCPTNDDVWFNFIRILSGVDCTYCNVKYMDADNTKHGRQLYSLYNEKNNDIMMIATAKYLHVGMGIS